MFLECFRYLNRHLPLRILLLPDSSCNLACVILRDCRGFTDCKVWAFGQIRLDCLHVKCCEVGLRLFRLDHKLTHLQITLELLTDVILKILSHST